MVGGVAAAEGEEEGVRRARVAALPRPQAGGGAGQEHSEHGAAAVLTHTWNIVVQQGFIMVMNE